MIRSLAIASDSSISLVDAASQTSKAITSATTDQYLATHPSATNDDLASSISTSLQISKADFDVYVHVYDKSVKSYAIMTVKSGTFVLPTWWDI